MDPGKRSSRPSQGRTHPSQGPGAEAANGEASRLRAKEAPLPGSELRPWHTPTGLLAGGTVLALCLAPPTSTSTAFWWLLLISSRCFRLVFGWFCCCFVSCFFFPARPDSGLPLPHWSPGAHLLAPALTSLWSASVS